MRRSMGMEGGEVCREAREQAGLQPMHRGLPAALRPGVRTSGRVQQCRSTFDLNLGQKGTLRSATATLCNDDDTGCWLLLIEGRRATRWWHHQSPFWGRLVHMRLDKEESA